MQRGASYQFNRFKKYLFMLKGRLLLQLWWETLQRKRKQKRSCPGSRRFHQWLRVTQVQRGIQSFCSDDLFAGNSVPASVGKADHQQLNIEENVTFLYKSLRIELCCSAGMLFRSVVDRGVGRRRQNGETGMGFWGDLGYLHGHGWALASLPWKIMQSNISALYLEESCCQEGSQSIICTCFSFAFSVDFNV